MLFLASLLALASVATASVLPVEGFEPELIDRSLLERDTRCTNGPKTRACWKNGFNVATDFNDKYPTTGKTVSYQFTITNGTCNPDGHGDRVCLLVNNQYPGPAVVADWGDMVSVTVTNKMQDNGTSVHWHGLRQLNNCGADGVPGITQCPIAPGDTYTYTFQATQYGTSWYHSHYTGQYGDGVVGPIIFNGPASANYDIDLGAYPVTDWYYQTVFQITAIARANAQLAMPPPNADTVLINGTNKDAAGQGQHSQVTLTPGKKHRLRLVNTAVSNFIRVSLDDHVFEVITSDFIPIKPFFTKELLLGSGQRYDVIIHANQTAANYWFRAVAAKDCGGANETVGLGVFNYKGVKVADPSSSAYPDPPPSCIDPLPKPYWKQSAPSNSFGRTAETLDVTITKAIQVPGGPNIYVWALNGSIKVDWEHPTLDHLYDDDTHYENRSDVFTTLSEGKWNYWIIQTDPKPPTPQIPHPIHLHGHDFLVLGQGVGVFNATAAASLNFRDPTRRDTATLAGGGWLALAWLSNNPGAWLMHCHIAFHISEGFGVQFTESPKQAVLPDRASYDKTCASWSKYYSTAYWKQIDAGV